jgi:cellobiose-specific phosphotransferase system component IIC
MIYLTIVNIINPDESNHDESPQAHPTHAMIFSPNHFHLSRMGAIIRILLASGLAKKRRMSYQSAASPSTTAFLMKNRENLREVQADETWTNIHHDSFGL